MASSIKATCGPKLDLTLPFNPSRLENTCVLITGGASSIGLGLCKALARLGSQVVIADINEDGREMSQSLRNEGLRVDFQQTDVTDFDSQLNAFKASRAISDHGAVDIVIPCAGVSEKSFREVLKSASENGFDHDPAPLSTTTIDVNLKGVYYTTYLACHFFRSDVLHNSNYTDKQIVFVSSLAGYRPLQLNPGYAAAKYGVRGLWHAIRDQSEAILQGSQCKIRMNLIAPFFVRTNLTRDITESLEQRGIRIAEVGDVVDAALRCICDNTISGRAIVICCGDPPGSGNRNFDLEDDAAGGFTAFSMSSRIREGVFGSGFNMLDC
ncbi:hypothetical protein FDECE_2841 [Fusarium decemcellulare]|nr:hypothetical protein FDECE_2841 [Fusarium decemcellulare]